MIQEPFEHLPIRVYLLQMNDEERTPLHRLGSLGVAVALIPAILGFKTAYWLHEKENDVRIGLWEQCTKSICKPLSTINSEDFLNVVRSFAAMALFFHMMSVFMGCFWLACHTVTVPIIRRWEEISAIIAVGLLGSALAVYAISTQKSLKFVNYAFDWSFWLSLFAFALLSVSAAVITLGRNDCALRTALGVEAVNKICGRNMTKTKAQLLILV